MKIVIDISEKEYLEMDHFLNGERIKGGFNLFKALEMIRNGTPLEPERKPGKWIERTCGVGAHCDQCGKFCQIQFTADRKYCPNCGTKMEVSI